MKRFLLFLTLVTSSIISNAVVVQRIQLKNGTVLNGYIQQQDKNDNITFRSESAVICVSGKDAQEPTDRVYKISDLDKNWVEWAEKNDAFMGTGNDRTIVLNEIVFKKTNEYEDSVMSDVSESSRFENDFKIRHTTVSKVRVLEKGINLKYLELTPNTYTFNWSDVENIRADRRPKTALTGIDRVYQMKNGQEISGQYAGESYSTLSLYNKNGMVQTVNIDNVVKYLYKGINPNQNIFEQSELIDIVRTKNDGVYRGIITERNFTANNNYLRIEQENGSSQLIKFSDVAEYSKEDNPKYSPLSDIFLKYGEVVVNRIATDSVGTSKTGSVIILDSINKDIVVKKEGSKTKVTVEYYNPEKSTSEHLMMVKLDKTTIKKKTVYCFTTDIYELKKFNPKKVETSVNNTTRMEYELPDQGVYAIFDQGTKKAMPFIIK